MAARKIEKLDIEHASAYKVMRGMKPASGHLRLALAVLINLEAISFCGETRQFRTLAK